MNSLEQEIDCLKIKNEGLRLEYEYVNEKKNQRINTLKDEIFKKEEENKSLIQKNQELEKALRIKNEKLNNIENSRWWKLRNFLRRDG